MIVSLFLRHFKIYKGISFIPLSEGCGFSSLIGENGVGKSSVLEAIDFAINKKNNQDWPINNEAKAESGMSGTNVPFIAPVFLVKKDTLRNNRKDDQDYFEKAGKLSSFLWNTNVKTKAQSLDEFYLHRDEIRKNYNEEEYFLILIGKKYNEGGIYFGSYHNYLDFINPNPLKKNDEGELQAYFKGFYDYIISHYSYIYIPVETDVHTYTKLETLDMQKLMDKNIQSEIENAIKPAVLKQINKDLDNFVQDIESVLEIYEYKGHYKNSLTMPDLVSKIIEAYFSIKVLNRKSDANGKRIPVRELSSGEKRKALIDVAYSFLLKNNDRESNIILAIDEPEASLHMASCYSQFEKLIGISKKHHQIIISTHWYGYLPVVTNGSATSIRRSLKNEIKVDYFNLYNYREQITQSRKNIKGVLPVDYNIKSYNDLVQSIIFSLMQNDPYNWIICEGLSEKIYFEEMFKEEINLKNLRLLPLGSFKEVRKLYFYLLTPIKDPDYTIKGKIFCIIDTDNERVDVQYEKSKNLFFERLIIDKSQNATLIDVNSNITNPATEIEDCLNPILFYQTLLEFIGEDVSLDVLLSANELQQNSTCSANFLDLKASERKVLKDFFDSNEGYNKIRFAKKYTELSRNHFFMLLPELSWVSNLKEKMKN